MNKEEEDKIKGEEEREKSREIEKRKELEKKVLITQSYRSLIRVGTLCRYGGIHNFRLWIMILFLSLSRI